MIIVSVRLFGGLRDRVDGAVRGRLALRLAADATIADALAAMHITRPVLTAINEVHDTAVTSPLADGDTLLVFEQSAGG